MRMEYLPGLTLEEACSLFTQMCGHVSDGNYSRDSRYVWEDTCGPSATFAADADYDTAVWMWLLP